MALEEKINYIEDDWNDGSLSGRTNASTGFFKEKNDSGSTGNLIKAINRPEWNVTDATVTANNRLQTDPNNDSSSTSDDQVNVNSEITVGTWSWESNLPDTTGSLGLLLMIFIDSSNLYSVAWASSNDNYEFSKTVGGAFTELITGPVNTTTGTFFSHKVTRDDFANWEAFFDGSSYGTTSDDEIINTEYVAFGGNGTGEHDNLVIN